MPTNGRTEIFLLSFLSVKSYNQHHKRDVANSNLKMTSRQQLVLIKVLRHTVGQNEGLNQISN